MNDREIYIIYSVGRTGSHMILEAISGDPGIAGGLCNAARHWYPKRPIPTHEDYNSPHNIAIHTHQLERTLNELNLNTKDVTLIVSKRRDIFSQAMSYFVGIITQEWTGDGYTNKSIAEPQSVLSTDFFQQFRLCKNFLNYMPDGQYKKVVSIYYEDIIEQGIQHIASMLDVQCSPEHLNTAAKKIYKKSPYYFKDYITNWYDLYRESLYYNEKTISKTQQRK